MGKNHKIQYKMTFAVIRPLIVLLPIIVEFSFASEVLVGVASFWSSLLIEVALCSFIGFSFPGCAESHSDFSAIQSLKKLQYLYFNGFLLKKSEILYHLLFLSEEFQSLICVLDQHKENALLFSLFKFFDLHVGIKLQEVCFCGLVVDIEEIQEHVALERFDFFNHFFLYAQKTIKFGEDKERDLISEAFFWGFWPWKFEPPPGFECLGLMGFLPFAPLGDADGPLRRKACPSQPIVVCSPFLREVCLGFFSIKGIL